MKPDDREIAADGQQDHPRAMLAEAWVELQRARHNLGPQKRSRTVTDNDDFLGFALARNVDEVLSKAVDPLIPLRPLAVREFPGPDRVREQIKQICRVFGVLQHGAEGCEEQGRRRGNTERIRDAQRFQTFREGEGNAQNAQGLDQQQEMRVGDEGRETPMRLPESREGAAEDHAPIDPYGMENRAPDRLGKVALDQVFPSQKIVTGAGLPVVCPGLDGPGCGLAVFCGLRAADGGVELIQPAKLPQLGSEHAVILRQTARIVSLHIDDMAVLNAHLLVIPELARGLYQAMRRAKSYFGTCALVSRRFTDVPACCRARACAPGRHGCHWTSSGSVPVGWPLASVVILSTRASACRSSSSHRRFNASPR